MKQNYQTEVVSTLNNRFSPYILILLLVVLFNLIAIFGLDVLLFDDQDRYWHVTQGHFTRAILHRSLVGPFIEWGAYHIMAISPQLIRGIYVILLMAPLSCFFYYIYSNKFGLPRLPALTAAILPSILPNQDLIPAFINGSYVLYGLLFALASFYFGLNYLEDKNDKGRLWLILAFLTYCLSSQTMAEHAVFLFPPFVIAFLGYTKFGRRHIVLLASFLIIALFKIYWTLFVWNYAPNQPVSLSSHEILGRIGAYVKWASPLPLDNESVPYFFLIFSGIILAGFLVHVMADKGILHRTSGFVHVSARKHAVLIYGFAFVWAVSTSFAFLFVSRFCNVRHFYISYFGLYALFILSLYGILCTAPSFKFRLDAIILISLVVVFGIARYSNLNRDYSIRNQQSSIVRTELKKHELPQDSQIVIVGSDNIPQTSGWWRYSTGYLQFVTKRKDITGLLGLEYSYYDPFNERKRLYDQDHKMNGLSLKQPLFLFGMLSDQGKLRQYEYALQWKGKSRNAPWTILKTIRKSGKIESFLSGTGLDHYLSTMGRLQETGIPQSEILWGGAAPLYQENWED